MNIFQKFFFPALALLALVIIYSPWIFHQNIIGGDWPYFHEEMLREYPLIAPLWLSNVFGLVNQNFPLFSYQTLVIDLFFNTLNIPWSIISKTFWFFLYIILSFYSIRVLIKTVFKKVYASQKFLGILIYLANTYILMIVGGGQMGVALAYSIAPLVLVKFIKLIDLLNLDEKYKFKYSIIPGLLLSLLVLFDLRLAYIIISAIVLYFLFNLRLNSPKILLVFIRVFLIPSIIVFFLHLYWILPFLYFHLFSLPKGLTSVSGFNFFSFGSFSQTLSLLHPNWPENIFGKTYFTKSEFIILPILAYSSLLFLKIENKLEQRKIIFFVLLGLIGAFLAKGVNLPFGAVNEFLFQNFPGMNMFRDPTKFYLLIIISYSILIPFSIFKFYEFISHKQKNKSKIINIQNAFLLAILFYMLFLIRPALLRQLSGTFTSHEVPKEYDDLKNFILDKKDYSSILWVPTQSRFRVQTEKHPLLNADYFFNTNNTNSIVQQLNNKKTEDILKKAGVKYIVIPYDSMQEIFIKDRNYNPAERINLEKEMDKISFLKKISSGKISLYETKANNDLFWLEKDGKMEHKKIGNLEYELNIKSEEKNTVFFANLFDKFWRIEFNDSFVYSKPYKIYEAVYFNSFEIPKGEHKIKMYFEPQKYINTGYILSFLFLIIILSYLFIRRNK